MNLTSIKEQCCETCGAVAVSEERDPKPHAHGGHRESRRFACGRYLVYSTNFNRIEVLGQCPKHPDQAARAAKHKTAFDALFEFINKLDVDESWKAKAQEVIKYLPGS